MSLSRMTLKRLPTIKTSLRRGLNREQIGAKCGVTEKTIDRDMKAWVQSGLFDVWLREEFLDLHNYVRDEDPIEAYRQIAKLVGKGLVHRIESETTYTEKVMHIHVSAKVMKDESATNRRKPELRAT